MEYPRRVASLPALVQTAGALIVSTRPKQWTKNLLIYLALFFTIEEAWSPQDIELVLRLAVRTALAFAIFSALSGAIYLVNDIFDLQRDRQHPIKRNRPIASGRLPITTAGVTALVLGTAGISAAFVLEGLFGVAALAYVATMVAYTLVLKRVVLLDVFAISAGFVVRAVAGAAVIQVPISPWLYICTGVGALFIALAKRRSELAQAGQSAATQRETLRWYSQALLDQFITVIATSVVMAYSLYTFTAANLPENHSMMLTIPFVVYGLFRYMHLVHAKNLGENPEDIVISDVPLIVSIVLWLATSAAILITFRG